MTRVKTFLRVTIWVCGSVADHPGLEVRCHGDRPSLPVDLHPGVCGGNSGTLHAAALPKLQHSWRHRVSVWCRIFPVWLQQKVCPELHACCVFSDTETFRISVAQKKESCDKRLPGVHIWDDVRRLDVFGFRMEMVKSQLRNSTHTGTLTNVDLKSAAFSSSRMT